MTTAITKDGYEVTVEQSDELFIDTYRIKVRKVIILEGTELVAADLLAQYPEALPQIVDEIIKRIEAQIND